MGVHGLWELLAPVGRRVSVETLAGKKLAIDASIWMVQFMKAMRDEKGEMVRNAHLIGFFRRICKLLFLRTKPVFVFDGGTPALKRRTVVARRRQRENAQAKIRKTAEKLLINHLKAMKLKQVNEDIRNQRQEHNAKGKKVLTEDAGVVGNISVKNDIASGSYDQEKLDEMLAASLAAEEDGSFTGNASTSAAGIPLEEEEDDDDEDEEMILPAMHGKVDPAVLAALPPSMQLDLLVQMREKLMAENRQKYQKVKKAPAKFSELQIQSYLKTVAFRREIDEVRKSAAGRGVGGVQTSRIASESNREFIFSSSFTGDKQALTSAGAERNGEQQHQTQLDCPSVSMDSLASSVKSSTATGSVTEESGRPLGDNVETYLDERGHVRVSRVRALGIRMTRDLQRNLDMMKEIEQESTNANKIANFGTGKNAGLQRDFSGKNQFPGTSNGGNDENDDINESNQQFLSTNETSIQISFEDDGEHKCFGGDDDLFASLVAGNPVMISSVDETFSRKQSSDSASDSDWEEGIIGKDDSQMDDIDAAMKPSFAEGSHNDESEVEWEEGVIDDVLKSASPRRAEGGKVVSRGCQEEEAELQDAIRRSLEDLRDEKCVDASIENESKGKSGKMDHKHENPELILRSDSVSHENNSTCVTVAAVENQAGVSGTSISQSIDASGRQLVSPMTSNFDNMEALVDGSWDSYSEFHTVKSKQQKDKLSLSPVQLFDASGEGGEVLTVASSLQVNCSGISESAFGDVPDEILLDASKNDSKAGHEIADHAVSFGECSVEELLADIDLEQKLGSERDRDSLFMEKEYNMDNILVEDKKRAKVTEASVEEEILMLGQEYINLGNEQRKNERNAESVSSEMFAECQELLQMFGLPYIIAPMEAEAQCAYLELVNLVDGVVTDDCDVFLFGARNVYKNIFDDRKYVETYFMKDIENELGLTREKIIRMALLLGSDYTEGISGIGIVNAIEVVNAFPEEDGLQKFREWIESPDPNILGKFQGKTGSGSKKRRLKVTENDVTGSDSNVEGASASLHNEIYEKEQSVDQLEEMKQIFMDKHRNVSKNWHIPSSFPSGAVISAYDSPQVDKSTEPFSWGKPDLFVLRKLCWDKFGWSNQKADELLLPVLKEYSKHETQLRLEAFYSFNERFAKIRSKRIEKAVKGITGNHSLELIDDSVQEGSKTRKKRRISHAEPGDDKSEKLLRGTKNDVARNESNSIEELHSKQLGRRKSHQKRVPSMVGNIEPSIQAVGKSSAREVSSGKRRKENRQRRQQVGRGRKKRNPIFESADSSSSSSDSSNNKQEVPFQKLEEPLKVRRSARSRKPANYIVDDLDNDVDESLDQRSEECIVQQPVEPEISQLQGLRGDVPFGPIDNNQHKFGEPSLEPGLCGDFLETGGGFCMNGNDNGEPSVSRENASFEDERSKDYLEIGGGFCVDEDETDKAPDEHANNPTTATVAENDNFYHNLDSVDKSEHENQSVQSALSGERAFGGIQNGGRIEGSDTLQNLDLPDAANNDLSSVGVPAREDDGSTTSVRALSAMPFLRRKRRKT